MRRQRLQQLFQSDVLTPFDLGQGSQELVFREAPVPRTGAFSRPPPSRFPSLRLLHLVELVPFTAMERPAIRPGPGSWASSPPEVRFEGEELD